MRWLPLVVVALAFLSAGPVTDVLAQPLVDVIPGASGKMPGGTIVVSIIAVHQTPYAHDFPACVNLRIEGHDYASSPGTSEHVCLQLAAKTILLPPHAVGVLLVGWNGTVERIPFKLPQGTDAHLYVDLQDDGIRVSDEALQDWNHAGAWQWAGVAQVAALAGFLVLLALHGRLSRMTGLLALVSLAWIPLSTQGFPSVPAWLVIAAWTGLAVEAFQRVPDDAPPAPSPDAVGPAKP